MNRPPPPDYRCIGLLDRQGQPLDAEQFARFRDRIIASHARLAALNRDQPRDEQQSA